MIAYAETSLPSSFFLKLALNKIRFFGLIKILGRLNELVEHRKLNNCFHLTAKRSRRALSNTFYTMLSSKAPFPPGTMVQLALVQYTFLLCFLLSKVPLNIELYTGN